MAASFFGIFCIFFNVRVNYQRFSPLLSEAENTRLFRIGIAMSFSPALLGVFDPYDFIPGHVIFAIMFFISTSVYIAVSASIMEKNRAKFSVED